MAGPPTFKRVMIRATRIAATIPRAFRWNSKDDGTAANPAGSVRVRGVPHRGAARNRGLTGRRWMDGALLRERFLVRPAGVVGRFPAGGCHPHRPHSVVQGRRVSCPLLERCTL